MSATVQSAVFCHSDLLPKIQRLKYTELLICLLFCMGVKLENCALLGYYATSSGNFLPTFRDNLSVPSSEVVDLDP